MRLHLMGVIALPACGDKADTGAPVAEDPDIQLAVTEVTLGNVPKSGWGQQTAAVETSNQGDSDLSVSAIAFDSGETGAFQQAYGPVVLAPGGVQWVTVVLSPGDVGTWAATLRIASDDPDTPEATVAVSGEAAAVSTGQ